MSIIDVPEGEEKEKGVEKVFDEILAEKFTNLKEENIQVQEAQRVLNKMNQDRSTPRHLK